MKKLLSLGICALSALAASAINPVVQTCFTTDPAPMVEGDTLYIYTGHDEDGADFFWMQEWRVYSTTDMVNWTDHGSPLAIEDFSWGDDRAWAPQCIKRDGKYFFYVPLHSSLSGGMAIGVAVGDTPVGPFKDALGKPLYDDGSWFNIDPTVFIDDDEQAYLVWGNPTVNIAKLNRDMISFDGPVVTLTQTVESFGAPDLAVRDKNVEYKDLYVEGPWLTKHNGKYLLLYAAGGVPEHISYSMADSPMGPWTYMGEVMPLCDTGSFTNHCGIVDFKDHSYFFYHSGHLPGGGGFGRSVCVEEFDWNPDGTLPLIMPTTEGAPAIGTLNPYRPVQAETMCNSLGINSDQSNGKIFVSNVHNGDWLMVANVDLGNPTDSLDFKVNAASALRGGTIELHADSIAGPLLAQVKIDGTDGWENWQEFSAPLAGDIIGTHDLYMVFTGRKGPRLFNLDWWIIEPKKQ